ncbi:MAG: polysaccharide biosynthesis/export family protein [Planctomycetes bacterium]|nr:polysaccharide biosynthesis/export family protein [Planctomycetota bacterium]
MTMKLLNTKSRWLLWTLSCFALGGLVTLGLPADEAPMVEPAEVVSATTSATEPTDDVRQSLADAGIVLCQHLSPAAPYPIRAIDTTTAAPQPAGWGLSQPFDWQPYAQGEYVGHARSPHVCEYRLRADDLLECVFRVTRDEQSQPYRLNVGDEIKVESLTDPTLNRENLIVQPDGTITLPLVGQVKATRLTVTELREVIDDAYQHYYKSPSITVTPLKVNTKLEDLRATVDKRQGFGGQSREARVTPEGTIALPAVGNVPAQGLTLGELKRELDERYAVEVEGLEVTPVLLQRAPRYVYVLGEVRTPGRYTLEGPTTVMQSISMAGGWNVGGNLRQVIIFRRGDDWRLLATMLDIRGAVYARTPCPADEVWINDSDIVVVPKSPLLVFDDWAQIIFQHGIYRVFPFTTSMNFGFYNTLPGAAAVTAGS